MAKIMLTKGFRNVQVGADQLLTVKKVRYEEKFGKIVMTFADEDGGTLTETFSLIGKNDKPNETALGIFSTIAKCVTHDQSEREIDPDILVGGQLIADVIEQEASDGSGKKYLHLRNYREADEDDEELF